ncbi:hypothetical protein KC945_02985 [Candidatus Saccharibacteria bacterium]|nr:hypothetical protein [Candidatus Saccharibacteria bacterium]
MYKYNWDSEIAPYLSNMNSVDGGFTQAKRGVITLPDQTKIFVKLATDSWTHDWLKKELIVYNKLNDRRYDHIAKIYGASDDSSGIALEFIEKCQFSNQWDDDKVDSLLQSRQELKSYKSVFENDNLFDAHSIISMHNRWPEIDKISSIEHANQRLNVLGQSFQLDTDFVKYCTSKAAKYRPNFDTLVHHDIRADNFAYDSSTKHGRLIDWNWLCIGDDKKDLTSWCISVELSGYPIYSLRPELFCEEAIIDVMGYWIERISQLDDMTDLRKAQAKNIALCAKLITTRR